MARRLDGFSLIELVVVITLIGILAGVVGSIIGNFVGGITTAMGRQELAGAGRLAMERMVREIRTGLPNSYRNPNAPNSELEEDSSMAFMRVAWVGRYKKSTYQPKGGDGRITAFAPDDPPSNGLVSINPLSWSNIKGAATAEFTSLGPTTSCSSGSGCQVNTSGSLGSENTGQSKGRRVYFSEEWVCFGKENGKVWMNIAQASSNPSDCYPSDGSVLVSNVEDIKFSFTAGKPKRAALVEVELQLTNPEASGEPLTFVQDVHGMPP